MFPRQSFALSSLVGLLVIVYAVSAIQMSRDALWSDEIFTYYYSGGAHFGPISFAETLNRMAGEAGHEKNPPGYYLLMNGWGRLVGWSPFSAWTQAVLASMLAIAITFRLGYDLLSTQGPATATTVGLGSAAALAGSAFFLYYAHELRSYAILTCLSALILWTYWRLIEGKRNPWLLPTFALSISAALYIHYYVIVLLAAIGLYHLLLAPKNRRWVEISLSAIIGGILFVPWFASFVSAATRAGTSSAMPGVTILTTLVYAFSNNNAPLYLLLAILGMSLSNRGPRFIVIIGAFSVVIAIAVNAIVPVLSHIRYMLIIWSAMAVLIGLGIDRLRRGGIDRRLPMALIVAVGLVYTIDPAFIRSLHDKFNGNVLPWNDIRAAVTPTSEQADLVAFHSPAGAESPQRRELEFYTHGLPAKRMLTEDIEGRADDGSYQLAAQATVAPFSRVWLIVDRTSPANFRLQAFEQALAKQSFLNCFVALPDQPASLALFARVGQALVRYKEGISLSLVNPATVHADGTMRVIMTVDQRLNAIRGKYSLGLYVLDANDRVVQQADRGLSAEDASCETFTFRSQQSGSYRVAVALYEWQTGIRLTGQLNGTAGDLLTIGTIRWP